MSRRRRNDLSPPAFAPGAKPYVSQPRKFCITGQESLLLKTCYNGSRVRKIPVILYKNISASAAEREGIGSHTKRKEDNAHGKRNRSPPAALAGFFADVRHTAGHAAGDRAGRRRPPVRGLRRHGRNRTAGRQQSGGRTGCPPGTGRSGRGPPTRRTAPALRTAGRSRTIPAPPAKRVRRRTIRFRTAMRRRRLPPLPTRTARGRTVRFRTERARWLSIWTEPMATTPTAAPIRNTR